MIANNTSLSKSEINRLISELRKEENFILANLCKLDNAHDSLEEVNQWLDFYESLV